MKMSSPKRRILSGIVLVLLAAYLWAVLMFSYYAVREQWFGFGVFLVAIYAVAISSWFVIPLGATLGYLLPTRVTDIGTRIAVIRGILAGVFCGVLASLFTAGLELRPHITGTAQIVNFTAWFRHESLRFLIHLFSMPIVSAICVGMWAYILNKKAEQGGAPNAHPRHAGMLAALRRHPSRHG